MVNVSQTDFGQLYAAPKNAPLITEIVPLNRKDSILVTLERKRYLVYNYITGQVVKEVLPIRGSYFRACSDFQFDIKTKPWVILYNANSIRRVDIQTFEVKKSIDMSRISGVSGRLMGEKSGYQHGVPQKQANDYSYNKNGRSNSGHNQGYR